MARKMIVVIPQLTQAHIAAIWAAAADHGFEAEFYPTNAAALPALPGAEIVFGHGTELSKNAPDLRWLCTPMAGVDAFLAPDAFLNPYAVLTNSSGAFGVAIAEHIVMVTLEMMRCQVEYLDIVRRRGWKRDLKIDTLRGKRITILGTGDIGREAAIRLRSFSPRRIVGVNRSGQNPNGLFDRAVTERVLEPELPETDLLIMALPATVDTHHLMDRARLSLLPENAYVVNVGRGATLDQTALMEMLRDGRLAGAALDVFDTEPPAPEDPLWACPRLLITPHVAGNMMLDYTVDRVVGMFLKDFENYCAGKPLTRQVDLGRGY